MGNQRSSSGLDCSRNDGCHAPTICFHYPIWRTGLAPSFEHNRIAIETQSGAVVKELNNPRESFFGHVLVTPWSALQRAYFNGYALWTYLTTPFFFDMPGFKFMEIEPWKEEDEIWRGLRVHFPSWIETHSTEQDFYFGHDFLLRRHDYHVDIAGGFAATQYVYDIVEIEGLKFPTKRMAYMRDDNLKAISSKLMVSIKLTNFRFS